MSKIEQRMAALEAKVFAAQRTIYAGLCALVSSGKVTVGELTDEELEHIVMGGPGDLDIRQLSDAELEAIVKGDTTAWQA